MSAEERFFLVTWSAVAVGLLGYFSWEAAPPVYDFFVWARGGFHR